MPISSVSNRSRLVMSFCMTPRAAALSSSSLRISSKDRSLTCWGSSQESIPMACSRELTAHVRSHSSISPVRRA